MILDLRQWLDKVDAMGELKRLKGADWDLEMGAISLLSRDEPKSPAILIDEVKGSPKGFRFLANACYSTRRAALTLNLPPDLVPLEAVRELKNRIRNLKYIPPKLVKDGPVLENVLTGKNIDLFKFPTPRWNELDGGRYIGTGSVTITEDPDEHWINLGTYRVQIHDKKTLGFYVSPGKHARIHREKTWAKGQTCKVALSVGHNPIFLAIGASPIAAGISEYDVIGGLLGEPVRVIRGPYSGLPIPADAEIVIEGDSTPDELVKEGPFGEWTRYYGSGVRPEPIIKVKSILHRNDPILLGEPMGQDITGLKGKANPLEMLRSAQVWDQIEKAGIPMVKGVWNFNTSFIVVISIKQAYLGHARQALLTACGCRAGAYCGRFVIVVDDDVDPSDLQRVMWALATRTNPQTSIDIIQRCWSTPLDPMVQKGAPPVGTRALIDACKPYEWINDFPKEVVVGDAMKAKFEKKWKKLLED